MDSARFVAWSLIAVGLAGCTDTARPASHAPGRQAAETAAAQRAADPCAIALTPHAGDSPDDREIATRQTNARRAADAVPQLERLGWAFVARARTSFDPGFYTLAEQTARCIESRGADSAEALLLRGHVLHAMHRFQEAEELARRLIIRRGRSFDFGLLGDVLMEQGQLAEAVTAYQRMMDEKPSPQAYARAAHVRWLTGDLAGAGRLMQMAVGASGFSDPEAAAWAHVRLAFYALQAKNTTGAERHLDQALALQADYPPALLARGRMRLAGGDRAEAARLIGRATARNPLPEYQWALVEALRASGRTSEAAPVETALLAQGPSTDRRTAALYLATSGRDVAAAVRLAEDELSARADVFTLDAVAWALHAAGRHHEARGYSERAMAQGTHDARLFVHAGIIAASVGRTDDARRWLDRAAASRHMLLPSEDSELVRARARLTQQERRTS